MLVVLPLYREKAPGSGALYKGSPQLELPKHAMNPRAATFSHPDAPMGRGKNVAARGRHGAFWSLELCSSEPLSIPALRAF